MTGNSNKVAVALSSVFASGGMVVMKLTVGLMTGSLGILSEAAHSGLDLWAATLTWAAVRVSDRPADERHPFGHGKFESLSALFATVLLFLTAAGVAREAILRLLDPGEAIEVTWYGIAVIALSMVIDFGRSRALARVAKETGSHALEADALHFSTDIISSFVVLLGLAFVYFGFPWADAAAALGVSVFIGHAGWELGRRTLDVLVDAAPEGIAERVKSVIAEIPGIAKVAWVRARPAGTTFFVDAAITVSRTLPLERVEQLRLASVLAVKSVLNDAQVLIIAEPLALDDETITQTVHVLASSKGLSVHSVGVARIGTRIHVSLHMEVDAGLTIAQAHAQASAFEAAIEAELGADMVVDIHIDPRRVMIYCETPVAGPVMETLKDAVAAAVAANPLVKGFHQVMAQTREDGLYMSCHCLFPDDSPIYDVHEVTEKIEYTLMRTVPGLATVVVHAEPVSHPETDHVAA